MRIALSALLATAFAAPLHAAEDRMTFTLDNGVIIADGPYVADTPQEFQSFVAANGPPAEEPWNTVMYVTSPGGDLVGAIEMGKLIRARGLSVVAHGLCASACTYMVMGGVNRVVTRDARYAVHQFFDPRATDQAQPYYSPEMMSAYLALLAELYVYAKSLGVDDTVVTIASQTPPATTTDLTREQLVTYLVDNVPTDAAEGQELGSISIPGVTTQVAVPRQPEISLEPLPHIISKALSRRVIMAETLGPVGMEVNLLNAYGIKVEYNGTWVPAQTVLDEKRALVANWSVRRREIDEASWLVTCEDNNISCTVTGEFTYDFGLEGATVTTDRWRFEHRVTLPLALPRITAEAEKIID
jgi:hypothetical protein